MNTPPAVPLSSEPLMALVWQPAFELVLTREVLDPLLICSSLHYDHACRSAGQVGGFLYGWQNQLEWSEAPHQTVRMSTHQLDICLKILELSGHLPESQAKEGAALRQAFWKAARAVSC